MADDDKRSELQAKLDKLKGRKGIDAADLVEVGFTPEEVRQAMQPMTPESLLNDLVVTVQEGDVGAPFAGAWPGILRHWRDHDQPAFQRACFALKQAGVHVTDLKKLINRDQRNDGKRGQSDDNGKTADADRKAGQPLAWPDEACWPDAVDGDVLLDGIVALIEDYVVMPVAGSRAAALWVAAAWALPAFDIFPRFIYSAETSECGKTTAMNVTQNLLPRPLSSSNSTPAVIFRAIDAALKSGRVPSLVLDEFDQAAANENPDLKSIVNSGHTRGMGYVLRTVGDDLEPRQFPTFAPMLIGMIGRPWRTIESRSIVIDLVRKKASEKVRRWSEAEPDPRAADLKRKLKRWAADNVADLRSHNPSIPAQLQNRVADNWQPLLAVADLAGGRWSQLGREAALYLSGVDGEEDRDAFVMFLADVRAVFDAQPQPDRVRSAIVIEQFNQMEERPWPTWNRGKPFTAASLGKLAHKVKPTGGVRRKVSVVGTVKFKFNKERASLAPGKEETAKGYYRADFEDAFSRFLPTTGAVPPCAGVTGVTSLETQEKFEFSRRHQDGSVTPEKCEITTQYQSGDAGDASEGGLGGCSGEKREEDQALFPDQPDLTGRYGGYSSFKILGPEPDHPCEQCGGGGDGVYLIRDPFRGVAGHVLHEACAAKFYGRESDDEPDPDAWQEEP